MKMVLFEIVHIAYKNKIYDSFSYKLKPKLEMISFMSGFSRNYFNDLNSRYFDLSNLNISLKPAHLFQ